MAGKQAQSPEFEAKMDEMIIRISTLMNEYNIGKISLNIYTDKNGKNKQKRGNQQYFHSLTDNS